jgi:hypothetical protein
MMETPFYDSSLRSILPGTNENDSSTHIPVFAWQSPLITHHGLLSQIYMTYTRDQNDVVVDCVFTDSPSQVRMGVGSEAK